MITPFWLSDNNQFLSNGECLFKVKLKYNINDNYKSNDNDNDNDDNNNHHHRIMNNTNNINN